MGVTEYQGTGIGVTMSIGLQGWVPLYEDTGTGVTVSIRVQGWVSL